MGVEHERARPGVGWWEGRETQKERSKHIKGSKQCYLFVGAGLA